MRLKKKRIKIIKLFDIKRKEVFSKRKIYIVNRNIFTTLKIDRISKPSSY